MGSQSIRVAGSLAAVATLLAAATLVPPSLVGSVEVEPRPAAEARPQQGSLKPFDAVPAITLPTTAGPLALGDGAAVGESYVLVGYSALSGLSQSLWTSSFDVLLASSPSDVHYVFLSYTQDTEQHAADMASVAERARVAVERLADPDERQHWAAHLHFVSENPLALAEPIPWLLTQWGPTLAEVTARWADDDGQEQSLAEIGTTDSGWAASLAETGPLEAPLGLYGPPGSPEALACAGAEPIGTVTGTIALLERGVCPFVDKVASAAAHGAVGALVYTDDREIVTMGGSCDPCPQIPAIMIDREPGLRLSAALEAGVSVTATLAPRKIGVELLAVDHQARARELGSVPFPFNSSLPAPIDNFKMVAFGAQYFRYEHERDARLSAEEAAGDVRLVPVFVDEWADDPGWAGKMSFADVELPGAAEMAGFDTMEVDLSLGCPDRFRGNCPAWDYIADMYLCDAESPDDCGLLVGRWITPYWAEGRWVTDITPMLAWLSDGGARRFAFYTQQRYEVDLVLRLSNRGKGVVPKRAVDLGLDGGPFWDAYNSRFQPIEFDVPDWAEKVEVASLITGHGFGKDAANCAEFCNHTHHISVNDAPEHVKRHPEAATLMGCTEQVPMGVVPNQGGTWIYGRAGWCPGLDVTPWVVDVTDEVVAGERNRLTYRALFEGRDYVPTPMNPDAPEPFDALIRMKAYLVYWAAPDVVAPTAPPPHPTVTPTATATQLPVGGQVVLPWTGRNGLVGEAGRP